MPIYEYMCEPCRRIMSVLILRPKEEEEVRCSKCGSKNLVRVLSRFAIHKTEEQRLKEFDPRATKDESFYKDSRNVGLWAKKRLKELGADLGPELDEIVERGRTGKILEDYDL